MRERGRFAKGESGNLCGSSAKRRARYMSAEQVQGIAREVLAKENRLQAALERLWLLFEKDGNVAALALLVDLAEERKEPSLFGI